MPEPVFHRPVIGAATRALVIGVGHYPSLPGGDGHQMKKPEGLQQLQSPPVSAREFARWLIANYQSVDRPLATVQLHISEKDPTPFIYEVDGVVHERQPQLADMATVKAAIRHWYTLGNENPDDLMLFYFCGHGLSEGALTSLLMSDFASDPLALMSGALDLRGFHSGMDECLARHQCYFIDACRAPSTLLRRYQNAGDPILNPELNADTGGRARLGPKFMSTLPGYKSYAVPGQPSFFTSALLESLSGAAAGDEDGGDWVVKTNKLHAAMEYLVKEIIEVNGWEASQQTITDGMQDLPLNTLAKPVVPVHLSVVPNEAHLEAEFQCTDKHGFQLVREADPAPWRFRVPTGTYTFQASFTSPDYPQFSLDEIVRPPYMRRQIKVGQV
ncbi:caspase family protein [Stenotrophomonas maltophilia]|uniref:caspase family protein n=1 Tax=Stenotrophomonas maltophilia TaxID=40324 RepID=UPI0014636F00|nr:caspase family protein [Stenotrophomonas maltophilia]QJP18222.1 caspase family protein [Stenotrophomonas maltophilia]